MEKPETTKRQPESLQVLARKAINRSVGREDWWETFGAINQLPLPTQLKDYVKYWSSDDWLEEEEYKSK